MSASNGDDKASSTATASSVRRDALLSPMKNSLENFKREQPHQGLMKLEQARNLLGNRDVLVDDIKELLVGARKEYFKATRLLTGGQADKDAITRGSPKAALICVLSGEALPEAIKLVRWFCSMHMSSLLAVTATVSEEAHKMFASTTATMTTYQVVSAGASGSSREVEATTNPSSLRLGLRSKRALRLLRVLIVAVNSFIKNSRSKMFSTAEHVTLLDGSIRWARRAIDHLAQDCSADPLGSPVGKAAARLRGLTATACFTRLHAPADAQNPRWFENLLRMGARDVKKLLECISRKSKKGEPSYLQTPGTCIEAMGALRGIAVGAPQEYCTIAKAFSLAVSCMNEASEGKWDRRPALMDQTVRHALVACASHLAERVGRGLDDKRLAVFNSLWAALSDCCIMQTGGYVIGKPPPSDTAGGRALATEVTPDRGALSNSTVIVDGALGPSLPLTAKNDVTDMATKTLTENNYIPVAEEASCSNRVELASSPKPSVVSPAVKKAPLSGGIGVASDGRGGAVVLDGKTAPSAAATVAPPSDPPSFSSPSPPPSVPSLPSYPPSPRMSVRTTTTMTKLEKKAVEDRTKRKKESLPHQQHIFARSETAASPSDSSGRRKGDGVKEKGVVCANSTARAAVAPVIMSGRVEGDIIGKGWIGGVGKRPRSPSFQAATEKCAAVDVAPPPRAPCSHSTPAPNAFTTQQQPPSQVAQDATPPSLPPPLNNATILLPSLGSSSSRPFNENVAEQGFPPGGKAIRLPSPSSPITTTVSTPAAAITAGAAMLQALPPQPGPVQAEASAREAPIVPEEAAATAAAARVESFHERTTIKAAYPSLETAPEETPAWREGQQYSVVLGDSFFSGVVTTGAGKITSIDKVSASDGNGDGIGDGCGGLSSERPKHRHHQQQRKRRYVHLKYDFVPGRTNLDIPATLRQGPLAGADEMKERMNGDGQRQRWAAEMEYESRDPKNPKPVSFCGDASRAQDVECVLVFDGNTFVMERVSVVGALKNAQNFTGPASRSAGGITLEASMAKRRKKDGQQQTKNQQPPTSASKKKETEKGSDSKPKKKQEQEQQQQPKGKGKGKEKRGDNRAKKQQPKENQREGEGGVNSLGGRKESSKKKNNKAAGGGGGGSGSRGGGSLKGDSRSSSFSSAQFFKSNGGDGKLKKADSSIVIAPGNMLSKPKRQKVEEDADTGSSYSIGAGGDRGGGSGGTKNIGDSDSNS